MCLTRKRCNCYFVLVAIYLKTEDLLLLHDAYDVGYEPIITVTAGAAIKGAATQFSIDEFRLNRTLVANGMRKAVANALDGGCCRKDCKKDYCRPSKLFKF